MDGESLRLLLGQGLDVDEIASRFGKHPSTIAHWMDRHGLRTAAQERHAAKGGIERERLAELVGAGMTIAEIAKEVGLGKTTVRYWLRRYGMRTNNRVGPRHGAVGREAKDAGLLTVTLSCIHHGETAFVIEGRGYYRCKRCRADGVARRRRRLKAILVREAGGCCCVCGYDRYLGALQFHHLVPDQKRLEISRNGVTLSLRALREEAKKCVLVCSNCHAEIEGGVSSVPLKLQRVHATANSPNLG
jgi:transposase